MVAPEEIRVGDLLPPFVREGTVAHWNRFAAVNDEYHPHHWDDEVAKAEGFTAAFAMAPLQQSFFYAMLRDWAGDTGRIEAVNMRLRTPFTRGRTLTAQGRVIAVNHENGAVKVDLEIWQANDEGAQMVTGTASVVFDR